MSIRLTRSRRLSSVLDAVGNTPLIRLERVAASAPGVEVYVKLEFMNPGGSVKDRPAMRMMLDAIKDGRLTQDRVLIDSTSGNTGVAYSLMGAALGYRVQLVMPSNVTKARKDITQAFGTELIYSDPMEGSDGAIRLVREIVAKNPDRYFYPDQYSNPSNPLAHYLGTGREIWEQTGGRVTHFVTGIGTSGTVMGTGRRLKDYRRDIEIWAVEPDDALHGLEGLKHMASSLVPAIYHPDELNGVIAMPTEEAWDVSDRLAKEEGLLVGHSSGGSLAGGMRLARQLAAAHRPGVVVTLFPDRADRYFEAPIQKQQPPPAYTEDTATSG